MSAERDEEAHPLVGKRLREKWLIERVIGRGGMATVFAATHRNGMRGAIKVLNAGLAETPEVRARFVREGRAANKIDHPGVVKLLDDDVTEDGRLFLVMELLEGKSLRQRWDEAGRKLPAGEAVAIAIEVADILDAAHRAGVVHRDVKPDNVFLLGGTAAGGVKLLDFGIARMRDVNAEATQDGSLLGTPAFMSPEQALARWEDVDHRSDLFSLGATLRTVLSGRLVHPAKTMPELLIASATQHAKPTLSVLPGLPTELCAVIDKALAFDKRGRWQSAAELRDALRSAAIGLGRPPAAVRTERLLASPEGAATLIDVESEPPHGYGGTVDLATSNVAAPSGDGTLPPLVPPTIADPPASRVPPRRSGGALRAAAVLAVVAVPTAVIAIWRGVTSGPPAVESNSAPDSIPSVPPVVDAPGCGATGDACCASGSCQSSLDRCVSDVCRGSVTRLFGSPAHVCATRADGRVWCWGEGSLLGRPLGAEPLRAPIELPGIRDPKALAFGKTAAFAIREGKLFGWGSNAGQLLGAALPLQANVGPADAVDLGLGPERVTDVAIGLMHDDVAACAIVGKRLECWGRTEGVRPAKDGLERTQVNLDGLRDPRMKMPFPPVRVGLGAADFACGVLQNDLFATVACWGASKPWLLWKREDATRKMVTFAQQQGSPVGPFSTGPTGACWGNGRQLQCWGAAGGCAAEALVDAQQMPRPMPRRVDDVAVALGHQCVVLEGGELRCWGNSGSAFGAGKGSVCKPQLVPLPQAALSVVVSTELSCALTKAGAVYCYGSALSREELGCPEPAAIDKPCRAAVPW